MNGSSDVAQNGSGVCKTIQAALDALPVTNVRDKRHYREST
jgi:hypothetical protein